MSAFVAITPYYSLEHALRRVRHGCQQRYFVRFAKLFQEGEQRAELKAIITTTLSYMAATIVVVCHCEPVNLVFFFKQKTAYEIRSEVAQHGQATSVWFGTHHHS